MEVIEFFNRLQHGLHSTVYVDILWDIIRNKVPNTYSQEERMHYCNHLPVEFNDTLCKTVLKLRRLVEIKNRVDWSSLNHKYVNTLIYFTVTAVEESLLNRLQAASMFFLFNTVRSHNSNFFFDVTYKSILNMLRKAVSSATSNSSAIVYTLKDFKVFLSIITVPKELVATTAMVLEEYTYFCNEICTTMHIGARYENLGHVAFLSLLVLVRRLSKKHDNADDLFLILTILTSDMKTSASNNHDIKFVHQSNVRLFVKQNFDCFSTKEYCTITRFLKYLCFQDEYDDYNAIALFIIQTPSEIYHDFREYLKTTLISNRTECKRRLLDIILPLLVNPPEYETIKKHECQAFTFLQNIIILCSDGENGIREKCLEVLANYSETSSGKRVLQEVMQVQMYDNDNFSTQSHFLVFHDLTDMKWHKKTVNVNYIKFICNLLITEPELGTIESMKQFSKLCLSATPHDLKPCLSHFKGILEAGLKNRPITSCILGIIEKQILDVSEESARPFLQFLHKFIFDNVRETEECSFMWETVFYMMQSNFPFDILFQKFHSMNLLKPYPLRILIKHKIHCSQCRVPALKLTNHMLTYFNYNDYHDMQDYLLYILLCDIHSPFMGYHVDELVSCMTKILSKKFPRECTSVELNKFKQIQSQLLEKLIAHFYPRSLLKMMFTLIDQYCRLTEQDTEWHIRANTIFQENLHHKLGEVLEGKIIHRTYFFRYAGYVGEMMSYRQVPIDPNILQRLRQILDYKNHNTEFSAYIRKQKEIWLYCIEVYVKLCVTQPKLIPECIMCLQNLLEVNDAMIKIKSFMYLYDVCCVHSKEYEAVIPHLFNALMGQDLNLKQFSCQMLMKLIDSNQVQLTEARYYIFMTLLADPHSKTSEASAQFIKDQYAKMYFQTIAKNFVPSIFCYNNMEHPSFALSAEDDRILREKRLTLQSKISIYTTLFEALPDTVRWKVLKNISEDVLLKFIRGTIRFSPNTSTILKESLYIILLCISREKIDEMNNENSTFFTEQLSVIEKQLLLSEKDRAASDSTNCNFLFNLDILDKILESLFTLLYGEIGRKCLNDLMFTILSLTSHFFDQIQFILNDNQKLQAYYRKLSGFYKKRMAIEST